MKDSTLDKLTPEMREMASLFCGSNTGFGRKPSYKAWQRHLNAYLSYFEALDKEYPARTKASQARLDKPKVELLETLRAFKNEFGPFLMRDKKRLPRCGVFGTSIISNDEYFKDISKVLVGWKATQEKKNKPVAAKLPVVQAAPVEKKAVRGAFGSRRITLDAPKKTLPKPVKAVPELPVVLTIGDKSVDISKLLAIPGVQKYIEEQTIHIVKEQNFAKAQELQAQIESLGFEVTLR